MQEAKLEYYEEGQVASAAINNIVALVIGVVVITVLIIMGGVLAGTAYQKSESLINEINNTTISNSIKGAAVSGFEALEDTADYMTLIILAVIIFIVLGLVIGLTALTGSGFGGAGGGAVL